jgi:gluconokinase
MVLALDVGTSSVRASLRDAEGRLVHGVAHQVACEPVVTAGGGVEHDPHRLLEALAACVDAVHASPHAGRIEGVGVAAFWHGLLGFDGADRPITPLYTWADTRSAGDAELMRSALDEAALHARTGCHLHASYWPAKLRWLARERPDPTRRVARWGSFGEQLEQTLFGQAGTSLSMASGTGLLDQEALDWDPEALAAAGLPEPQFFPLRDRDEPRRGLREPWASRWPRLRRVPWFPAVGDGAASNIGSGCADPARIALNVGTSAALRVVTSGPPRPPRGLWRYRLDRRLALVGGATSEGGNVYAWCLRVLRLGNSAETALVDLAPDAHGLTVLPFLAGERSPGWRGDRRAAIAGLGLDTTPLDILQAALESVALRLALVYDRLAPCASVEHTIVASGRALVESPAWAQIVADALGRPILHTREAEATSRGVALLTAQALGRRTDLAGGVPPGATLQPDAARHARYREALARQQRFSERV